MQGSSEISEVSGNYLGLSVHNVLQSHSRPHATVSAHIAQSLRRTHVSNAA